MNSQKILGVLCVLLVGLIGGCAQVDTENDTKYDQNGIIHGVVYGAEGRFAAWPANVGIWIWDNNEVLTGFMEGAHDESTKGLHKINWASERAKFARSMDGGETWEIEDAYENGQTTMGSEEDKADPITKLVSGVSDFTSPDFVLTFRRANNDDGPSHFYFSENRGKQWIGPFDLSNMGTPGIATRTDYLVKGKQQMGAFLTVAKENKQEGRVAYAETADGGVNWEVVSWLGPEPDDFDIMPSTVRLSDSVIYTAIRTRTGDKLNKMTAFRSTDNGQTWEPVRDPVADTGRGGSPPALVKLKDGRLALAYAYRSEHGSRMCVRFSKDDGATWSDEVMLRGGDGASRDVGYPVMTQRADGKLLMVYYWNNALQEGADPYRYIAYTIFDPEKWKQD